MSHKDQQFLEPTDVEFWEIAVATAMSERLSPDFDDFEASVPVMMSVQRDYMTGGPGYIGPVYHLQWDGDPDYITIVTKLAKPDIMEYRFVHVGDDHAHTSYSKKPNKEDVERAMAWWNNLETVNVIAQNQEK